MNSSLINNLNWPKITTSLNNDGYVILPKLVSIENLETITGNIINNKSELTNQSLEEIKLGSGVYSTWNQDFPSAIKKWLEALYEKIAPIATNWNIISGLNKVYPETLEEFIYSSWQSRGHVHSTSYRLGVGDYQPLHQDIISDEIFPIQIVILLSEPERDFTGGEFVMVEQRPRMQSRPMVLPLNKGDVALISGTHRPFRGSKGYYSVKMRHAVSRITSGNRISTEFIFSSI